MTHDFFSNCSKNGSDNRGERKLGSFQRRHASSERTILRITRDYRLHSVDGCIV